MNFFSCISSKKVFQENINNENPIQSNKIKADEKCSTFKKFLFRNQQDNLQENQQDKNASLPLQAISHQKKSFLQKLLAFQKKDEKTTPIDKLNLFLKIQEIDEIFSQVLSLEKKRELFEKFLEENHDHLSDLLPRFLEEIHPRDFSNESMNLFTNVLKTKFPPFSLFFHSHKQQSILNPEGLKLIVRELKARDKIKDCFIFSDLSSFKEFISFLNEDEKIVPGETFSCLVRCTSISSLSSLVHISSFYFEKTSQGWRLLQLDSSLDNSASLAHVIAVRALGKSQKNQSTFYFGGQERQKDGTSCPLFSLHDLLQIQKLAKKGINIFDYIDQQQVKEPFLENEETNFFKNAHLPPQMMKMTQNLEEIDAYEAFQKENNLISEKVISIKKYQVRVNHKGSDKIFNALSQKRFLQYQAILIRAIL